VQEIKKSFNAISDTPAILQKKDHFTTLEIDPVNFKRADALLILKQTTESPEQLFNSDPKFADGSVGVLSLIAIMALARKRMNHA
jgi:hypothetical protein